MERSSEVEATVASIYDALQRGDMDAFAEHLHDDVTMIGTDPNEWWFGKDDAVRGYGEQARALGGGITIEPGEIQALAAGDVGWYEGRLAFVIKGERVHARDTGVLVREDGVWRLIQNHFSLGVANEWAVGSELPV